MSLAVGDPLARFSATPSELKELLAVERAGTPFLAVRDARGALHLHTIADGAHLTICRRAQADVSIAWDGEVSGLHSQIESASGEWTIVDDGLSRNGTFVNGQRVRGRRRLRDGDRIRIGQTVIAFNGGPAPPVAETALAGGPPSADDITRAQRRVLVALCRPFADGSFYAAPASNKQIADEIFLSVESVKMHLRALFTTFGLNDLPQNQKRAKLAETALRFGLVSPPGA
jgi:FHA domain-containing protein